MTPLFGFVAARGILASVEAQAWKPDPRPYWRSSVSNHLFLAPDEVSGCVHLGHRSLLSTN
jgi:hypothetical protein